LVIDMNWDRVIWYAQAFPQTARFQEGDTAETPLHAAVQCNPSVWVVRHLVDAYPAAVFVKARNGESPLHMACRYKASVEVLQELVKHQPSSVFLESKWGSTPILALWRSYKSADIRKDFHSILWQKIQVLLEAVARSRREEYSPLNTKGKEISADETKTTLFMVHAAVSLGSLGCPVEILDFCMQRYPQQIQQLDESECLPLHLVVGPTRWSCGSKRRYKPREKETIERLLQAYPVAASIQDSTSQGRLPLHSALVNRHEWLGGVEALARYYPDALWQPDPINGLLPFLAAATPVGDTAVDLTSIYSILRFYPNALEIALSNSRQDEDKPPSQTRNSIKHERKTHEMRHFVERYGLVVAACLVSVFLAINGRKQLYLQ
jgi:hypothetical protein